MVEQLSQLFHEQLGQRFYSPETSLVQRREESVGVETAKRAKDTKVHARENSEKL